MSADVALTAGVAPRNPGIIQHYHAHIYYDDSTRDRAACLRERVAAAFPEATLGRWHDELVGPHLRSMYQIAFPRELLASLLPWLMLNRDGLTILLHPGTGNDYADHSEQPRGWAASCRSGWTCSKEHRAGRIREPERALRTPKHWRPLNGRSGTPRNAGPDQGALQERA